MTRKLILSLILLSLYALPALANMFPLVPRYPRGDFSSRGVVTGVEDTLLPGMENELRVIKEDLTFSFLDAGMFDLQQEKNGEWMNVEIPFLVDVTAAYTIENDTDQPIKRVFGFPIARGQAGDINFYNSDIKIPFAATLDEKPLPVLDINTLSIGAELRRKALADIRHALDGNAILRRKINAVRWANDFELPREQKSLTDYLIKHRWTKVEAHLLAYYAQIDFSKMPTLRDDVKETYYKSEDTLRRWRGNLGPLIAIDERKTTQLLTLLASKLNHESALTYEKLFTDWGGDARDLALDINTGEVRPRDYEDYWRILDDPNRNLVYPARADYFDDKYNLSDKETALCKSTLQDLPAIIDYAPMSLMRFEATIPPKSTHLLQVNYQQRTHWDRGGEIIKPTQQFSYIIHPAKHWASFGTINLKVLLPRGDKFRASVTCDKPVNSDFLYMKNPEFSYASYNATLIDKPDSLMLSVSRQLKDRVTDKNYYRWRFDRRTRAVGEN